MVFSGQRWQDDEGERTGDRDGARLKLLAVASGTLPTVDSFSVVDNTTGKAKLKSVAVVNDGEGQSLVASFEGKQGLILSVK